MGRVGYTALPIPMGWVNGPTHTLPMGTQFYPYPYIMNHILHLRRDSSRNQTQKRRELGFGSQNVTSTENLDLNPFNRSLISRFFWSYNSQMTR
jgi:hypothetical protein